MQDNTVILAALGIVTTCVACLVWVVKYLLKEFKHSLDKNAAANEKVASATKLNTEVSKETLQFMKNLNGKLEGAFVAKVKEKNS